MKRSYFAMLSFFSILFVFTLLGCEDNGNNPTRDWNISISVLPDIGTTTTEFKPDVTVIGEMDSILEKTGFQFRCDYDNDGLFETDWLDTIPATPAYSQTGKHTINILARDLNGYLDTAACDIYVQELIQITPTNTSGHVQGNIDWSKDGTNRIAFDMTGNDPGSFRSIFIFKYPNGEFTQVSFNPDTTGYYGDQFPEWSPDGNKIAFYGEDGLDLVDLNTGARTNIRQDGNHIMLSWSPNGRWLFYWNNDAETIIYDFTTDSTEVFFDEEYFVGWSPDGNKIATCKMGAWDNSIVKIIDFSSRNVLQEFAVPTHGYKLDWSPDGRWISLGFDYRYNAGFILDIETGRVYSWTPGNLIAVWYPSWSEDGSLLAFEALEEIEGMNTWTSIWAITFPEELR
jgi:Tol biopolymer transport system component